MVSKYQCPIWRFVVFLQKLDMLVPCSFGVDPPQNGIRKPMQPTHRDKATHSPTLVGFTSIDSVLESAIEHAVELITSFYTAGHPLDTRSDTLLCKKSNKSALHCRSNFPPWETTHTAWKPDISLDLNILLSHPQFRRYVNIDTSGGAYNRPLHRYSSYATALPPYCHYLTTLVADYTTGIYSVVAVFRVVAFYP